MNIFGFHLEYTHIAGTAICILFSYYLLRKKITPPLISYIIWTLNTADQTLIFFFTGQLKAATLTFIYTLFNLLGVVVLVLYKNKIVMDDKAKISFALVIVCFVLIWINVLWVNAPEYEEYTIIFTSAVVWIGGIHQIIKTWEDPWAHSPLLNGLLLLVPIILYWENVLTPSLIIYLISSVGFYGMMFIICLRRYFIKKAPVSD